MTPHRELTVQQWHRLNQLLGDALELEGAARNAWLAALPPDTADLRPVLAELLTVHEQRQDTVSQTLAPVVQLASAALSAMRDDAAGDRIGPWRLERPLAEGGMGAVWIAQRADGVMQRTAALKLPRAEWVDRSLAQRIARERAILARLQHPHIAVLYDAGIADGGRPYLALEYVDGVPIDAWCREHDALPATVRLTAQVARAVAYAHGQLVIHRDLKPANVLVTPDGIPKLLDFGISKLIEGDATAGADATALTRLAGRPLTLAYAAPEQILGLPVTVAADVYALGVMLFELTTGQRLYRAANPRELEAEILKGDLHRPSDTATDKVRAKALRGDLDAIVGTALARNPADRYSSAAAFADDLDRYLDGRPVRARPDSSTYRLGKFLRRNVLPVAASSAVVVALGAGLATAMWQANEARDQATRATALNTFVLGLIRTADPNASRQTREADLSMLHSIEERIDHFEGSPDQLLQLRATVAEAYKNRGELVAAQRLLQRAVDEAAPHLPEDDLLLLAARVRASDPDVIVSSAAARQLQRAIELLRPLAATRPGAAEPLIEALLWQMDLGGFYGLPEYPTPQVIEATLKEALQLAIEHFGADSVQHLKAARSYAELLGMRHDARRVTDYLAPVLAQVEASGDATVLDSTQYATARGLYGMASCSAGEITQGMRIVWDTLVRARQRHGDNSYLAESLMLYLGGCLDAADDLTGATITEDVFNIAAARERPPSPNLLRRATEAFSQAVGRRDVAGAERYYQAALQNLPAIAEPALRDRLAMDVRLARVCHLVQRGEPQEAERMAVPLIAGFNADYEKIQRLTPQQGGIWICTSHAQREQGKYDEAVATARTFLERCIGLRRFAPGAACDIRALSLIALAELEAGRPDRARAAIEQRLERERGLASDGYFALAFARVRLAEGRGGEALDMLREAYGSWLTTQPHSPYAYEVLYWLGKAAVATGDKRGHRFMAQARQQLAQSPVPSHRQLAAGKTPGA